MLILRYASIGALLAYFFVAGYLYSFQDSFVFKPRGELARPAETGLSGVSAETVAMADGVLVTVWTAPPAIPDMPTVLFLHGNLGNISERSTKFAEILASGFGLYAPSHRGFPGSGGTPSEPALIDDALSHFNRLAERNDRIVLYGESLGTGVATAVAGERDALALILEAPFTAAIDIAAAAYPWLPVGLLMRNQFRSRERIGKVKEPLLIVHGALDEIVPVDNGRALFRLANKPKELVIIESAGHGNLWPNGLWARTRPFLDGDLVSSGE